MDADTARPNRQGRLADQPHPYHITLHAHYIRSASNVWADQLSRQADPGDWSLAPDVFRLLDRRYGPHTVDCFASENTALLPKFYTAWASPHTSGVDAFSQPAWVEENNLCVPPVECLDRLAHLLDHTRAAATVVAPFWPAQAWFQVLQELSSEQLLLPPGAAAVTWRMIAFRLERPCRLRTRLACIRSHAYVAIGFAFHLRADSQFFIKWTGVTVTGGKDVSIALVRDKSHGTSGIRPVVRDSTYLNGLLPSFLRAYKRAMPSGEFLFLLPTSHIALIKAALSWAPAGSPRASPPRRQGRLLGGHLRPQHPHRRHVGRRCRGRHWRGALRPRPLGG